MEPAEGSERVDTFSSKVSLNVATNVARTLIMSLIGFLMVPYYIGEFGLSAYAIIPLATSITTYFIAVSDALANAFTRYMTISLQNGDEEGAKRTFTSSVTGMAKCMMLLLPAVAVLSYLSPYIFDVADSSYFSVQVMFFMVLSSALLISFSASLCSVFMAYNKLYITYASKILHCVLQVVFVLAFFFTMGPSLIYLGASYMLAAVAFLLVIVINVRRVCPFLRVSRNYYDKGLLKQMSNLGVWTVVSQMGTLLFIQASMIIVNLMVGSESQGSFSIAANVISIVNSGCISLSAAVVPLVYRDYANKDYDGMVTTLKVFTKFVGLCMAFPLAFLILFAPQIIGLWLGPGYDELFPMLYVMLPVQITVCTVYALLDVPVVFLKMKLVAKVTMIGGLLNIVLAVLSIYSGLGVLGVCGAWAISTLFLYLGFYPVYASVLTDHSYFRYFKPIILTHAVFIVLMAVGYLTSKYFTMPTSWIIVLSTFFVSFIIYFFIVMHFAFRGKEKEAVLSYLPGFVQKIISYRF